MNKKVKFLAKAGIIAGLYALITVIFAPLGYGQVQVRISEALTILPYFTNAAIPGLFVGCLLANFFGSPFGLLDILLGSLTTLLAAFTTSKIKDKRLAPLPSIVANALVMPYVLWVALKIPYIISVFYVGLGQIIAVYALGYPLLLLIDKNKKLKDLISK